MRTKRLRLGSCEFSPEAPANREVRGQVKNLEGPQLFSLLRLWVAKVLHSTISAPVSPLLSQRKGIQQGPEGLSQSHVPREMGVSLTTMDKSLMTSRQCTLAPYCYHDEEKCFHKHMSGLKGESFLLSIFKLSEYYLTVFILWFSESVRIDGILRLFFDGKKGTFRPLCSTVLQANLLKLFMP